MLQVAPPLPERPGKASFEAPPWPVSGRESLVSFCARRLLQEKGVHSETLRLCWCSTVLISSFRTRAIHASEIFVFLLSVASRRIHAAVNFPG